MPLAKPIIDPQYTAEVADALNGWLPCPYTRNALLLWVTASLELWDLTRQVRPDVSPELERSMLREQYREWVEAEGDILSVGQ
ncbi:hypothetical protein ACIQVE_01605 [Pseudomonas sp. NPDC098747]|uniref:hypothetical protein n=1 Tax=Pseudomonas sp. NPDC098747 TaxID=3364487 RepID=UPI00383BACAA